MVSVALYFFGASLVFSFLHVKKHGLEYQRYKKIAFIWEKIKLRCFELIY